MYTKISMCVCVCVCVRAISQEMPEEKVVAIGFLYSMWDFLDDPANQWLLVVRVIGTFKFTIKETFIVILEMKTVRSPAHTHTHTQKSSCASQIKAKSLKYTCFFLLTLITYIFGGTSFFCCMDFHMYVYIYIGKILKIAYPLFDLISIEIYQIQFRIESMNCVIRLVVAFGRKISLLHNQNRN